MSDVTQILLRIEEGDGQAAEQLLPLVYEELRKLAARKLAQEKPGQTLQATALVHEAYIRLVDVQQAQHWESRRCFFAAAAEAMRRVLVDNARKKQRPKHGGGQKLLPLGDVESPAAAPLIDIVVIDEAISKLSQEDPQKAELVKLRYFAGLSMNEISQYLGISRVTASRHWTYAKAWLYDEIYGGDCPADRE